MLICVVCAVVRVSRASHADYIELFHREMVTGEQLGRMIWIENQKAEMRLRPGSCPEQSPDSAVKKSTLYIPVDIEMVENHQKSLQLIYPHFSSF